MRARERRGGRFEVERLEGRVALASAAFHVDFTAPAFFESQICGFPIDRHEQGIFVIREDSASVSIRTTFIGVDSGQTVRLVTAAGRITSDLDTVTTSGRSFLPVFDPETGETVAFVVVSGKMTTDFSTGETTLHGRQTDVTESLCIELAG